MGKLNPHWVMHKVRLTKPAHTISCPINKNLTAESFSFFFETWIVIIGEQESLNKHTQLNDSLYEI